MKTFINHFTGSIALIAILSACSSGDDNVVLSGDKLLPPVVENQTNPLGIPSDALAGDAPVVTNPTINMPGISTEVDVLDGWAYMKLTFNGVLDPVTNQWLTLKGTGYPDQNVWVSVDGTPKGIDVYNTADSQGSQRALTDIVFLVDNSGSMSEEANEVAKSIKEWVSYLESNNIDVKVGCVGYDGAINGGINLTNVDEMKAFLDRSSGTSRTKGFVGSDASALSSVTENYRTGGSSSNECGMAAWHFANDNFTFRNGANRIYINFTDEPNQPNGNERFSVEWLNPQKANWVPAMGTIHTVFSDSSYGNENTTLMSTYTGGTIITTNSSFSGVSLMDLPVTGAIANSYIIRFTNIDSYMDGLPHTIVVTIATPNGNVLSVQTFSTIFRSE